MCPRLALLTLCLFACGQPPEQGSDGGGAAGGMTGTAGGGELAGGEGGGTAEAGGGEAGGTATAGGAATGGGTATAGGAATGGGTANGGGSAGGTVTPDAGFPNVDRSNPQLYQLSFTAKAADDAGTNYLGTQHAYLDTRVAPRGQLVVYLHGATGVPVPTDCGGVEHGRMLAGWGFHFFAPCYSSEYGVGNCGQDIGGCRLEAFDGMPRNAALTVTRPDSIEERIIKGLQHLQRVNPKGGWEWYLVNGQPRWSAIIISGISHGASSAGIIGKVRPVARSVMLSGPLDTNQSWLSMSSLTAPAGYWGLSHTADTQHQGHLAAFQTLMLPGVPTHVEDAGVPYRGSHRLITSVPAPDGHSSTQAGGGSPKTADGGYVYWPVWRQMYTGMP
ncbi:MAG: hypothetical protein IPJ65_21190 [Archangiaceae bacterium]|nr:hypothetical protein [Archangiaceae bacterium]